MVRNKYHTLALLPSTPGKRIVKLSLPSYSWWILCAMLTAIFLWAGIATWTVYHYQQIAQKCFQLEKQNTLSRALLTEERKKTLYLDQQLKQIRKQAAFVREFLGLEHQEKLKGKIGQGGVEVSPMAFKPSTDLSSDGTCGRQDSPDSSKSASLTPQEIHEMHTDFSQIIRTLEHRQYEMEHTPSISPVDPRKSWISSPYGLRISPFTGKRQFHPGIDIAGWKGTPILATANGEVSSVGRRGTLGLIVKIRHSPTYTTVYGHLLRSAVKRGQKVDRGDVVGYMGNSGRSTGYHVHYEIRKNGKRLNPFSYMMDWKKHDSLWAAK